VALITPNYYCSGATVVYSPQTGLIPTVDVREEWWQSQMIWDLQGIIDRIAQRFPNDHKITRRHS